MLLYDLGADRLVSMSFQATETVSWSRDGYSGLCPFFLTENNVLWKHTMASCCGGTRLAVILRTNLPMTPIGRKHQNPWG